MNAGFGNANAGCRVYLPNPPPIEPYQTPFGVQPLSSDELNQIVALTGNHWRKIFVLLSKLGWALEGKKEPTWQAYRQNRLLSNDGALSVLFSPPEKWQSDCIHVVAGKGCAKECGIDDEVVWTDSYFAQHPSLPLIVTPYLDYRQLSNARLEQLLNMIDGLHSSL